MKKELNKDGTLKGYQIGLDIFVHKHIHDPENWHLTVKRLDILKHSLCPIGSTELQIVEAIDKVIEAKLHLVEDIVKDVEYVKGILTENPNLFQEIKATK